MNSHLPATAPSSRRNWVRRLVNVLVALVVIAVAAATFVFSYDGVHAIALLGGMSTRLARYYPGLFDAVLVIACVATVVLRDGRWWARAWAWVVLVVVLAAIGTTDVLHAMSYSLRHRPTEGVVAAAPVVAVLLAFSLLLALLRQSRSPGAGPQAGGESADWDARRPTMAVPLDLSALPALPAAVPAADAATVEVAAMTADTVTRPPAPPIALPAGQRTTPLTPPDGLPAITRTAAEPNEALPPAAPPAASQRAPEGEPAPPTVSSPARGPSAPLEPAPARQQGIRRQGIRYAGSGGQARAAGEPAAAKDAAEPGAATAEPDSSPGDYWDGDDAGQFAGLVYPAREESTVPDAARGGSASGDDTGPAAAADDRAADDRAADDPGADDRAAGGNVGTEADGPASRTETQEIDEDAPPFATAPFAAVPRLNRVRSMPVPPEDDEVEGPR